MLQTRPWLLTNMTHDAYDMPCPPLVTTLDTMQYGVCDPPPHQTPPYYPILKGEFILDSTWLQLALFFFCFLAAHFGDAYDGALMPPLCSECSSLVPSPPGWGLEHWFSLAFVFFSPRLYVCPVL